MEGGAYSEMYELEDDHWWFRGRRRIIWALLSRERLKGEQRVLDAGCGTGRNLVEFGGLGPISGVDPSEEAVEFCHHRGLKNVQRAGLECLPFEDDSFDLLLACDVIEHVRHDSEALAELHRVAAPGATLIITAPAYQWMWTEHDVQLHHFRRYTLRVICARARAAGWEIDQATYFNSILFPVVAVARVIQRVLAVLGHARRGHTDLDRTPQALNTVLETPFEMEAWLVGRGIRLPAGVSLGVSARKRR
ncbi:MAG: class I SAM-dependent methyltransferase [Acidimicrobiales bacterium]